MAFCFVSATLAAAENIDPANDDSQYAYAENVGWLNAEPNGDAGDGIDVANFALTGWLWAENTGWVSSSCENTRSCGTVNYGVLNDGHGTLSGYAWGENVGWINFAPSTAGVSIDPATGDFSGRAWGENIGWVTFASTGENPYKVNTDWCQTAAAAPSDPLAIAVEASGDLSWAALADADWYEAVRGDLTTLRSTDGDFSAATEECISDNLVATTLPLADTPGAGDGFWFLVRGVNCKGKGTYDPGGAAQVGERDAEIAASGNNCP